VLALPAREAWARLEQPAREAWAETASPVSSEGDWVERGVSEPAEGRRNGDARGCESP
jgi:hypothetical protein